MDVQSAAAVAPAAPLPPVAFPGFADIGDSAAWAGSAAPPDVTGASAAASIAGAGTLTAAPGTAAHADETLKPLVAKLYNAAEQNVEVSFQVAKGLGEVVTVFTDRSTGKVIVQFPAESLVALAQFFQKLAGNILDAKA